MKNKKIIDALNQTMLLMCGHSSFAFFFFQLLHREITNRVQDEMRIDLGKKQYYGELVNHKIPSKKIKSLSWNTNQAAFMVQKDMEDLSNWVQNGKDIESYFKERSIFYEKEKELIIKRIVALSVDFTDNLSSIANRNKIPLDSIANIFLTITADDNLNDQNDKVLFLNLCSDFSIPKHISEDNRDEFISDIARQIYNLLVESLWVIVILDHIELINIFSFAKGTPQIDKIKSFLEKRMCFICNENIIKRISSRKDVSIYLSKNYAPSIFFLPKFSEFLFNKLYQVSRRLVGLKDKPLSFAKDYETKTHRKMSTQQIEQSMEFVEGFIDEIKNDSTIHELEHIPYDASDYATLYKYDKQTDFRKKQVPEDQQKFKQTEIESFANEIFIESLGKKISKGMIMKYKLNGNPEKLIKYIVSIIYNAANATIGEYYNQKVREKVGVSSKTLKRWEKDIKNGKINIGQVNRLGANDHIQELSLTELDAIKDQKEKNQKHQKSEHLNQTQLIKTLRNDQMLQSLNKNGVPLKKIGTTGLKKIIKQLEKDGTIRSTKEKTAVFYRIEDLKDIATEITKMT
jgi:hypothetical protein